MILSAKTADVERVTMEKCVKRILKQAEQIGRTSGERGRERKRKKEWKWSGKERGDKKIEKLKEHLDKERRERKSENGKINEGKK